MIMESEGKKNGLIIGIFAIVAVLVFGGIYITRNIGKSQKTISSEDAKKTIIKMARKVEPKKGKPVKSSIEFEEDDSVAKELPDIDTCEVTVPATTDLYAEIFCSPEKAGTGTDGWLCDMANEFNSQGVEINGQKVSVQIRNVSSGQAKDYIASGKAVPDGFSPSASMWVSILNAEGVGTEYAADCLVNNVAGIVIKNSKYKKLVDEYGTIDMKTITEATEEGKMSMGYTNPFTSTSGLNFLACTLQRYDYENPLSDTAMEGFKKFQNNVPFVALTTIQMRKAANKGTLDGFIMEYQSYIKDPALEKNYKFVPYGYIHNNPLAIISSTSDDKKEILRKFGQYCTSDAAQKSAKEAGFNSMKDYKCEYNELDGESLKSMQELYKNNKDGENAIVAVFIADTSGSMGGEPLASLKSSLVNSMKYINSSNYIGLVSYSTDVTIEVPIAEFDLNQQSLFKGSVEHFSEGGGTATFDAIVVGLDMIREQLETTPDAKPLLFVLSDGDSNIGYDLREIKSVVQGLSVPIYTIGYNANLDALQQISDINEAASINADTDDIVYQLKTLFNASL